MTVWETRLMEEFAQRYPSSAAASGGRQLRLRVAQAFEGLNRAGADEKESFLEAAEKLYDEGLIDIEWEKHRKGEAIQGLILRSPQLLFARLGRDSPTETANNAILEAGLAAQAARSPQQREFFSWMAGALAAEDGAKGIDRQAVCDFAKLPLFTADAPLATRALSVRLFSDSKRLEDLLLRFKPLLLRARRAAVACPDLTPFARKFPETLIAGKLAFSIENAGKPLCNESGLIIGLPAESAHRVRRISALEPKTGTVLGVENKETFYALSRAMQEDSFSDADALVYVGGHPNRAVKSVFRSFARSHFTLTHAGDLDPDGILILQELADSSGVAVLPRRMDSATFDEFFVYSRPLENTALLRAAIIRDDTRRLPGIEELLERILATGRGVEQEIIGY